MELVVKHLKAGLEEIDAGIANTRSILSNLEQSITAGYEAIEKDLKLREQTIAAILHLGGTVETPVPATPPAQANPAATAAINPVTQQAGTDASNPSPAQAAPVEAATAAPATESATSTVTEAVTETAAK